VIRYLLFPVMALVLIVLQVTLADVLFMGVIRIELTLILVIYLGFYGDLLEGTVLALILGFIFDTMTATVPFFYTLFYPLVFLAAKGASLRIYGEGIFFVMGFALCCSLAERVAGSLLYWHYSAIHPPAPGFGPVIVQSVLLASVVPLFFAVFKKCDGAAHVGTSK